MISKRVLRILLAGGITLGLLAAPITAQAAVPAGWRVDPPIPLPAKVSPGANAGYELHFFNDGPSTISQLYLLTANGPYTPVYAQPSQGVCSISGQLMCTLGQVKPVAGPAPEVTIVVAFATPASASGSFAVDFEFNTSGLGSGGGDNSHGDALLVTGTTSLTEDADNFRGGFVVTTEPVATTGIGAGGGLQSTTVFPPTANIVVTAADGNEAAAPPAAACPGCFGEFSQLNVDFGNSNGVIKVVIDVDKAQVPTGVTQNNMKVVHISDSGSACTLNVDCVGESATVTRIPGGNFRITLYLLTNGWVGHL